MMNNWGGMGSGGWLIVLIIVAVIVVAVVAIVVSRRDGSQGSGASPVPRTTETPEDILKRRYAAGEIDREEYERALRDLRS